MLLGNGVITNKLPLYYSGGVQCNTNWQRDEIITGFGHFEQFASTPNGYGLLGFEKAIKAGGISTVDFIEMSDEVNALNVDDNTSVLHDFEMGAYTSASISETILLLDSLSISASIYMNSDDTITVDMSAIAGTLIGATIDDNVDVSFTFEAGSLIGAVMSDDIVITLYSTVGAFYGGEFSDSVTITSNTPIIFGSALIECDESVTIGGNVSMIADGWMSADASETSGILTAQEIWNYAQRTLTAIDVEVSGLTTEEHNTLLEVHKILGNDKEIKNNQLIIYSDDGTTPLIVWDLKDKNGNATETSVFKSERI